MSKIEGINVAMTIVPNDTKDTYPTHEASYGRGGYRSMQTLAELQSVPAQRLEVGCVAYVVETDSEYRWNGEIWDYIQGQSGGNIYVTTFGVPTYLAWTSGDDTLQICGCNALTSDCELRLFRYKRRRTGADAGRVHKHGWRDCTDEFAVGKFLISGSGDTRSIIRQYVSSTGAKITQTPAQYQRSRGNSFSLAYRCAFAIFKNGNRVSDMMHFSVDKFGVYGSW